MTNAPVLAVDYLKRCRLRVRAVETLIDAGDFADAVRKAQETVELAVKAVLKLKRLSYPRAHDVARLLRDAAIAGPLLRPDEFSRIEHASKTLRRSPSRRRGRRAARILRTQRRGRGTRESPGGARAREPRLQAERDPVPVEG
jgi:HEPN domain-containing protein